jgi:hypothetical protein
VSSDLPTLDVFSGLNKWGEIRLRPLHRENLILVELRHIGAREEFKPIFGLTAIGDRIAFRVYAERSERTVLYDPVTYTLSNVATAESLREHPAIQRSEDGKDDDRGKDDAEPVNPRDGNR